MTVFSADRFEALTGESDERIDPAAEGRLQLRWLARNLRHQRSRWTAYLWIVSMLP